MHCKRNDMCVSSQVSCDSFSHEIHMFEEKVRLMEAMRALSRVSSRLRRFVVPLGDGCRDVASAA